MTECPVHKYDETITASMLDCSICGTREPVEDDPMDFSGNINNFSTRGA
jgi:hypothetical protein